MTLPQLRRIRWAVRAVLVAGVAASVAANVLHADPNVISQVIAAWPPLALYIAIELVSRVPVHRRALAIVRRAGTTVIAGIAAWVSYWHMAGVAARYGEQGASPYLLPFSVDGLVIVASVSLVELAGRIRDASERLTEPAPAVVEEAPAEPAAEPEPTPEPVDEPADGDASSDTPPEPHPTAVKIAALRKRWPRITQEKAAQRLSVSLRTVQRHWGPDAAPADASPEPTDQVPVNGRVPELTTT